MKLSLANLDIRKESSKNSFLKKAVLAAGITLLAACGPAKKTEVKFTASQGTLGMQQEMKSSDGKITAKFEGMETDLVGRNPRPAICVTRNDKRPCVKSRIATGKNIVVFVNSAAYVIEVKNVMQNPADPKDVKVDLVIAKQERGKGSNELADAFAKPGL